MLRLVRVRPTALREMRTRLDDANSTLGNINTLLRDLERLYALQRQMQGSKHYVIDDDWSSTVATRSCRTATWENVV